MEKTYTKQIKQFGKEIKKLRERHAMTQIELASRCGIDIRTIQRIEKGEYGAGLHIIFALAVAFEITPGQLLKGIKAEKSLS